MADVIARWLMELPLQGGGWQILWPAGRCYLPGQFFNFSSEMLNRSSSQMCGRWYNEVKRSASIKETTHKTWQ